MRADAAPIKCGGPYCFKYDVAVERPSVADLEDAGCRSKVRILECLALTAATHEWLVTGASGVMLALSCRGPARLVQGAFLTRVSGTSALRDRVRFGC